MVELATKTRGWLMV